MIRERTDANVLRIKRISTRVSGEAPFRRLCEVSGIKIFYHIICFRAPHCRPPPANPLPPQTRI